MKFDIKQMRGRFKITQKELAEHVGVAPNTIARWERGEAAVSQPALRLMFMLQDLWRRYGYDEPKVFWEPYKWWMK